jgi:acyl transferase domain-containing protein/NADPH:quinone reductase-like Zn-dependent oxidoreductase/acyl carrier protein
VLALLQAFIADERLAALPLVLITRSAVGARLGDEVEQLAHAPLWGMVRTLQNERPELRIVLLDVDRAGSDTDALIASALATGEPQLALREGKLFAPRLARAGVPATIANSEWARGTILITGGTGGLGAVVAEHVVRAHGARRLVLCSRRASAGEALAARLEAAGAHVTLACCDVSDREQVAALLRAIPAEHPLCAVFHAAGSVDDGVFAAQAGERFARVFAPKLDGAWHLHALTRELPLQHFVLFASFAGVLGGAGQSNYAAANAFLDALAHHRRARGLAGLSIDWGLWAEPTGVTAHLTDAERARMARAGVLPLPTEQALRLLDRALAAPQAQLVSNRFAPRLFATAADELPPLFRQLGRRQLRRAADPSARASLRDELATLSPAARARALFGFVTDAIAAVMGSEAAAIDGDRPLGEAGLDSLLAVELRNRLAAASGLRLPSTLLFDHPTPHALCRYLESLLLEQPASPRALAKANVQASAEPIAIVAMGCRYPGGADSPETLWELFEEGRDAISEFPRDRAWNVDALYDPDPEAKGKSSVCYGGFVDGVADFDPAFFDISPREALAIDPQQRLLLETTWEALERAGIDPRSLSGSATGVFVGVAESYYALLGVPDELEGHAGIGGSSSVASGRVAYTLGLEGPAVSVDTACSSSLVALHLASQSLRQGECDLALAGGVAILATPGIFVEFSRQRGLAPDGRCKAFSDGADGTGWAEGVGMLVLERLADAQRNQHPVLALMRGSAINQDGKSQGLTAPNGPAQERVIRQALANAQLTAAEVDVVDAHGTGTSLGDPIEAQALLATYGATRAADNPVWLGSAKSNLGHTQHAAGAASVMKLVLALQHGVLPKTLHAEVPTQHVDWSAGAIQLLNEPVAWQTNGHPRRAAVSSFGISGTNAHMILEEAPPALTRGDVAPAAAASQLLPLLVSARTEAGLRAQAERLRAHLERAGDLRDVAYSLATTRSAFEVRAVVLAGGAERGAHLLAKLAAGEPDADIVTGRARASGALAVLFSGQGSQRAGMGRELYEREPVFRRALDEVLAGFGSHADALRQLMFARAGTPQAEALDQTQHTQPALFALEVALYRLLESSGVRASHLLGHSVGEVVAAHIAGVMSLADACTLVSARARLMQALPATGAMAALQASEAEVLPRLSRGVSLAGVNGPMSVVISGDESEVLQLMAACAGLGRKARRLAVSHAFHSSHMQPMLAEFEAVVRGLTLRAAELPIVSNVSGEIAAPELHADPAYWAAQARAAVRFAPGISALHAAGVTRFLELGPQSVLAASVHETLAEASPLTATVVAGLRKERGERDSWLSALAALHCAGERVDWSAATALAGGRRVALPTYAFQRQRFWLDTPASANGDIAAIGVTAAEHPLLGARVMLADTGAELFTGRLSLATHPWLAGHVVHGTTILPGTAFVELALLAAQRVGLGAIEELTLEAPLPLPERGGVQLQLSVAPADARGGRGLKLFARRDDAAGEGEWTLHASGSLGCALEMPRDAALADWPPTAARAVALDDLYPALAAAGLAYEGAFRGLREVYQRGEDWFIAAELPEDASKDAGAYLLHPALLDAVLHALAVCGERSSGVRLPFAWQGLQLRAAGARRLRARLRFASESHVSLALADASGELLGRVEGLRVRGASAERIDGKASEVSSDMFDVTWLELEARDCRPVTWLGFGRGCEALGAAAPVCDDVAQLERELSRSAAVSCGVLACHAAADGDVTQRAREHIERVLAPLQAWSASEALHATPLLVLTQGAVSADALEPIADPAQAPVWGLVRSLQSEQPQLPLVLLDVDELPREAGALSQLLAAALAAREPQLAWRKGALRAPRLRRFRPGLPLPAGANWSLHIARKGTFEGLELAERAEQPLAENEVRVAVHAAGLNFRDVLGTLGMYPGDSGPLGLEGAGVVLEVGSAVRDFAPGDRVMGMLSRAFGPRASIDARYLAPLPRGASYAQAASIPLTFLTAFYGLIDLAGVRAGERVLIHAAAGGVGMAAVQLAQHLGAEVFATAQPSKWPSLRALGVPDSHIASSRTLEFEAEFRAASSGEGMDVVLDSLAQEFVDASLRLMKPGGRFIEMGKTDVRDPAVVAARHHGVRYQAFDTVEAGPDRTRDMLREIGALLERGALRPLPVSVWDVRQAPEAFRHMAQARHVGKIILSIPQPLTAAGTVLITGASGTLASRVAEHVVRVHGVRRLLLCSRSGGDEALRARLEAAGAHVTLARCDVAQRAQLAALLASIPAEHPLTAVFHVAGVARDAMLPAQTAESFDAVLAPKLDGSWHLHELTRALPLTHFVLFSSASGVLGGRGQSNYAAANSFLDALAALRHAEGLPAQALAWGLWAEPSGITAHLTAADRARMARGGVRELSTEHALTLLDAALTRAEPQLILNRFDKSLFQASVDQLPALFKALGRAAPRRAVNEVSGASLRAKLAARSRPERVRGLLETVTEAVSAVMAVPAANIDPERPLGELGLDSLMAVELRNRLAALAELRLPSTVLFDYPTPDALARLLDQKLFGHDQPKPTAADDEGVLADKVRSIPLARLREAGLLDALLQLVDPERAAAPSAEVELGALDSMSASDLVRLARSEAAAGESN